ncbi:MAG: serine protease, partial [Rhodospirillaceae bacterium]|nr:serine protease [Rhodospirillaceae bacterium]
MTLLLPVAVLGAALVPVSGTAAKTVPTSQAQVQLSFAPLVKQAAPAVVNIYTRRVVAQVARSRLFDDPFFRRFFGERFGAGGSRPQRRRQNSLGSGVLLTADGMIVTN